MTHESRFEIDSQSVRRHYDRRARTCGAVDAIPREIAARMAERLDYIRIEPRRVLDLGCGTGADLAALKARYPGAAHLGLDFSLPMLAQHSTPASGLLHRLLRRQDRPQFLAGDARTLPLAPRSISLVWSNLMLNWCDDPLPALREVHRVLEIDGLLMFSTLGPDTLKELRLALPPSRVHRFIDMHDLGDVLVSAGFSDPVMDMQMLSVTYRDFNDLLRDLRLGGHACADSTRPRGLTGRQTWARARQAYEKLRRDGVLPATLELVFGHAWKGSPKTDEQGRAVVRFDRSARR